MRADRRNAARQPGARRLVAVACTLACAGAMAQQPPAGSPIDVRYTPVNAGGAALYPRLKLDLQVSSPSLVVEVDRDGVPADGQSPVRRARAPARPGRPAAGGPQLRHGRTLRRPPAAARRTHRRVGPARPRRRPRHSPACSWRWRTAGAVHAAGARPRRRTCGCASAPATSVGRRHDQLRARLRPMVAAGLIEGVIQFRNKVSVQPTRRGDAFEQEIQSWAREFNGGKANAAAAHRLLPEGHGARRPAAHRRLRLRQGHPRAAAARHPPGRALPGLRRCVAAQLRCTLGQPPVPARRQEQELCAVRRLRHRRRLHAADRAGRGRVAEAAQPGQLQPHRHRRCVCTTSATA